MPRIAGITIPDNKHIGIALTYIYGIGRTSSRKILQETGIDATRKAADLQADELNKIKDVIEKSFRIEGELRRDIMRSVRRLNDINSWRGSRHARKLTVRGQTTRTNSRTVRGNVRKTLTSGRKPAASPT
jgi:small subunit ribosomal protein S13